MLTSLHVQNFKCLRDVKVEFGPLTVLIGPNDSGKSSILDALRLLGRTAAEPLEDVFKGANEWQQLAWKSRKLEPITWSIGLAEDAWHYEFTLTGSTFCEKLRGGPTRREVSPGEHRFSERRGTTLGDYVRRPLSGKSAWSEHFLSFAEECGQTILALARAPRFRLSPDQLRSAAVTVADAVLSPTGDNLVAVLDRLIAGPDRSAIVRLEQELHRAVKTLRGIALPTIEGHDGWKSLAFVLDTGTAKGPPVTIPCAHASDGAMLLTAFLALAFSDEPRLLLIEEPENGLHPSRLQSVVEMLRKISTGEVGNQPRQVILTTHSPLLLNYTRPEEVRIVQRDREKGTSVTPMSAVPDVHKLLEEFGAGELWYLLGEQGLVEGKKP